MTGFFSSIRDKAAERNHEFEMPAPARPHILRRALDFLVPPTCISCGVPVAGDEALCGNCWAATPFLAPPWCARLGRPFAFDLGEGALCPEAIATPPVYHRVRAACAYAATGRDLVHSLKYADRPALARALGRWMARAGAEFFTDRPLVVPVPLHRGRLWRRRFNQSALLASAVARHTQADLCLDALERLRRTERQVGLSRTHRARNVRGAFRISEQGAVEVRGRRVVLVDDVITTGSTATACTHVLKRAGAVSVDVLAFALAEADEPIGA